MIIATLIICAVLSFVFFIYIQNKPISYILTALSVIGIGVSTFYIVRNDRDHYGMEKVTTSTYQPIYSVSPSKQMKMLLYQPIGTANKHQVYIYQKSENAKKKSHTDAENTTNEVVRVNTTPRIKTTEVRWHYKNNAAKLWFGIAGENHKLVKRENTIYVNKDWLVLSTTQAKALQKQMSSKAYKAKLQAQAKIQKQAAAEFQAQAVQQLIQSVQKSK